MERRQGIRHEWAGRIFEVVQILRRTIPSTRMVNHLLSRCDGVEEVTNHRKSLQNLNPTPEKFYHTTYRPGRSSH